MAERFCKETLYKAWIENSGSNEIQYQDWNIEGGFWENVLDAFWFNDLHQLRIKTNIWMEDYNNNHPHSSLGNRSPREYRPRFGEEFFTKSDNIN